MMSVKTLAGRRVLLVEDKYLIARDMMRAFTDAGARVIGRMPCSEAGRVCERGIASSADIRSISERKVSSAGGAQVSP
jgi:hypothetical protein